MTSITFNSTSEQDTQNFAQKCAEEAHNDDIFLLSGPLGAGKSVFARSFIRHIAGEQIEVPSPTFTLVQTYDVQTKTIWHFDLYRLEQPEEIYELGWEEALAQNILLIEWSERLGALKPQNYKEITITPTSNESRIIDYHHVI